MPTTIFQLGKRQTFAAILFFGLLAMTARTATDPDLWWHLRTGQWIVETGHIPHSDPFSFTRAGHAWISHEWLSEVLFYELWKHAAAASLIIFSACITTAGFLILYYRCPGKPHWAAAATALGALASAPCWGVRPQMFTFTLASLLLWLLDRGEKHPKLLLWIPPLFLLWLNLHAGFALGPALMLAYAAGWLVEICLGSSTWERTRPILTRLTLLLLLCLALIPLNPSGAHLYRYPFDTLTSPAMRSVIGEWFSPDFHAWLYRPLLLVWMLLLTALASGRSRPRARVVVPLLLTAYASLDAVRHIPIFVLLAMPVIAAALPSAAAAAAAAASPAHSHRVSRFRPIFPASVVFLLAAFAVVKWVSLARQQDAAVARQFPQKAVEFLKTSGQPRNLFVYYDWGGYAIWKLYPEHRVFIDGRADLYVDNHGGNFHVSHDDQKDKQDRDLLRQFQTAINLQAGWREILDRWEVAGVLVPPSSALAQGLLLDPGWRSTFADSQAVLLVRTAPPSAENAANSRAGVLPIPGRPPHQEGQLH